MQPDVRAVEPREIGSAGDVRHVHLDTVPRERRRDECELALRAAGTERGDEVEDLDGGLAALQPRDRDSCHAWNTITFQR